MSCNSCTKPFSLLRKEKGCPNCGFSYCSKCLDNDIFSTKLNTVTKVCAKCKNSGCKSNEAKVFEAPDAYYRRVGMTDKKRSVKLNSSTNSESIDHQILERLQQLKEERDKAGSSTTDETIKKRLENIKGEIPSTSDAEIYARLAKLKGMPTEICKNKPTIPPPDTRTEQEQANDLIQQYLEQTNIDTKYKDNFDSLIGEIETRMQKLKGSNTASLTSQKSIPVNDDSDDEEETVKQIVEKLKAEASLEDEISPSEELPFCEICNEDAQMRCLGCKYLFCKRCFLEHKDDDDGCNSYEPYRAPQKQ